MSGYFWPTILIAMQATKVKMCVKKYHVLIFFGLVVQSFALNCRTTGGPKEEELKNIYRNCLRKQDGKNSSNSRGYQNDDWRESKSHGQRSPWDRDGRLGRDDRMGRDERTGRESRMGMNNDKMGNNRDDGMYQDRMGREDTYKEDRITGYDRMGSNYDMDGNYDRMGNRDERMNRDDRMGSRNDMMGSRNEGRSQINGRDDFPASENFGDDMSPYNTYRSSTQQPRRFKREKRLGANSGQRSQYNPNASNSRPYEDSHRNEDRNSTNNSSKKDDKKACAMHCFLENLEMTGDNEMPDRYLVTHAITKDVKNEDLRDFLQESIEECFQILDNENTEDKCEFSKNLLMCLSEKGRANCDDWKEDMQF